ncbi:Fc.00g052270.m01.CDS01 [Cosmosporella sp. VM-42]
MPAVQAIPAPAELARELKRVQQEAKAKRRESKKRKRSDDKDDQPRKRHKSDKKKAKCKGKNYGKLNGNKERARKGDDLYEYDPSIVELPTEVDFSHSYGPSRAAYTWKFAEPTEDLEYGNIVAPQPGIPDAGDDSKRIKHHSPDFEDDKKSPKKCDNKDKNKKKKNDHSDVKVEKRTQTARPPLPAFLRIPMEVREEIYRNLLVAAKPVLVRAGWTRIYEREKPCLDTSILRVNKQINQEAVRILYSENTFHYRLRDPPNTSQEVMDIQRLAVDDYQTEVETDDEDSRDLEYGGSTSGRTGGRSSARSRSKRTEKPWDINIPKFGMLFRHLIVEAEHNRYSLDTQRNMARAISVFTAQPDNGDITKAYKEKGKKGKAKATNIHTLSIRVAPMWCEEKQGMTFVDFFKQEFPVLEAMRAVSCQFLRVELLTKHLNPGLEYPGTRLVIDMRHRRIARRAKRGFDIWQRDIPMLMERDRRVHESKVALDNLQVVVLGWCEKYQPEYPFELEDWELGADYSHMEVEDWGGF